MNYYNENDPKAAARLRELIAAGHIPPGDVDTRSITEVRAHEIARYTQQHFFAGIGGWSLALRIAGWPDDRPVRTGSCPCQPFSQAGKGKGEADERHLWPVFRDLTALGTPTVTFGEQVASKAGRQWLAGIRADLEGLGYAVGAADLCAAGVGAPHIRQRLFWMANPGHQSARRGTTPRQAQDGWSFGDTSGRGHTGGLAGPNGRNAGAEWEQCGGEQRQQPEDGPAFPGGGGHPIDPRLEGHAGHGDDRSESGRNHSESCGPASTSGRPWDTYELLPCTDGKARRIEPGSPPPAHGVPARMVRLRGYGNAIVPQVAAEFILAYLDIQ